MQNLHHQSHRYVTLFVLLLVAVASSGASRHAVAQEQVLSEQWYAVEVQDEQAGWSHAKTVRADGQITTLSEMRLKIARDGVTIRIQTASKFVETLGGEPVSMWSLVKYSDMPVETDWVFNEKTIDVTVTLNGEDTKMSEPRPTGNWLTPNEASEYTLKRIKAGADVITLSTIDASQGSAPFSVTRKVIDREAELELNGVKYAAIECESTTSMAPTVVSKEFLDPNDGTVLSGTTGMGALVFSLKLTSKQQALQKVAAPELMIDTLVSPDRAIQNPRAVTRMIAELSVKEGKMPELPNTGAQSVTRVGKDTLRLVIRIDENTPAPEEDLTNETYLASTTYLDYKNEAIGEIVTRALKGKEEAPTAEKAEAIRAFVHRYVSSKNLDQGFATATEVAKTQSGDCSEHGVLLAAMLRGAGIPSRVATGLIYVERFAGRRNVFGYHMWAQALIDGAWVDYDATLPMRFDATHVTVYTSALEDGGMMTDFSSMIPLLGQLEIRVIKVKAN
ncbi:MAG: transglutaminase domain-containing protein [Planctomycetes bacterium]|nr:transglutaminase domain-containing protein [Planctomycetota bacterium]NOG55542.1 transglutaminase domain-containing protein [Planctomycetota bacterium]